MFLFNFTGARRFVVLDFGKPVLLTDLIIPACGDLASLSIDVWIQAEETDGHRLVVSTDIGIRSLLMNNLMPAPLCRYLKVEPSISNLLDFWKQLHFKN